MTSCAIQQWGVGWGGGAERTDAIIHGNKISISKARLKNCCIKQKVSRDAAERRRRRLKGNGFETQTVLQPL